MRLLLVDDDLDTLDLERVALQRAGATVECVTSVKAALEEHGRQPAAVIISDLAMPGQDGYDLARTLSGPESTGRVPLLAVSAHASNSTREKALAAGFDHFLTKPVHPGDLVDAVAALASRARPAKAG